jgi:hypothetical protein
LYERFRRGFVSVKGWGRGELVALSIGDFTMKSRKNIIAGLA